MVEGVAGSKDEVKAAVSAGALVAFEAIVRGFGVRVAAAADLVGATADVKGVVKVGPATLKAVVAVVMMVIGAADAEAVWASGT